MCFTKEISLRSFGLGIVSGILLILFGNDEYKNFNYTIGLFFMFVSLMQYVEYLLWSDTECKTGQNKFATTIGPILNHLQPTVLFLLTIYFLIDINTISKPIILLNIIYLGYTIYEYHKFVNNNNNKCTKKKDVHLDWLWKNDFSYEFYQIIMIINIFVFAKDFMTLSPFIISYLLFFYHYYTENEFVGELWCYSVNSVPLFTLLLEKVI